MVPMLTSLARSGLDVLFPPACAVCGAARAGAGRHLCWECREQVEPVTHPYCALCGDPVAGRIDHAYICTLCTRHPRHFSRARSAVRYDGPAAELLKQLKYRNAVWLRRELAAWLCLALELHFDPASFDVVIPVPLHHTRLRARGFNQAALLAVELSRRMNIRYLRGTLVRHRKTPTQTRLTAAERTANVADSFRIKRKGLLAGCRVLLVDDVMTTGATVNECARVLREQGCTEDVQVVTVARG